MSEITAQTLCEALNGTFLCRPTECPRVSGGYAGDFLSWVMSKLKEGDAWLTVMGNVNAVAVAVLADAACIVLCEGVPADAEMLQRAETQNIPVIGTELPMFEAGARLARLLGTC